LTKGHLGYTSIMLFCIAAFLSMWFNNAATAAMLLPLALGMVSELDPQKEQGTCTFVLLGLAFSASIGGLGTMIGTPPNMIAAQSLEMGFAEWLKFGLPVALVMFPLMIVVLYFTFRPNFHHESQVSLHDDFAWTGQRVATVAIFAVAVLAWIFGNTLSEWAAGLPLLSGIAEKNRNGVMAIKDWNAFVALAATVAVCTSGVATWRQVQEKMEWGVILLFGGGLTLSVVLQGSGAGRLLAGIVAHWLDGSPEWVVVFGVATFIIVLTEFTSNLAAAALLIPLFAAVSHKLGMPPQLLTLVIGIGASMAFMLPVATLTNAIVFASGRIRQRDMVKAGFYLSLVAIVVLTLFACLLWRSPMFAG
jgi:sodium-dependent dicarboxylate transporter 2/3/5